MEDIPTLLLTITTLSLYHCVYFLCNTACEIYVKPKKIDIDRREYILLSLDEATFLYIFPEMAELFRSLCIYYYVIINMYAYYIVKCCSVVLKGVMFLFYLV